MSTSVDVSADLTALSPSTTYYVRVTATNSNGSASSSIGSFTTSARPLVLTTTTGSLTTGTVATVYSKTLAADGGTAPYTWSVVAGSLPSGLSLNSTTGAISGTPLFDGGSSFTIEVTDATSQTATKVFSISVVDSPNATTTAATSVATTSVVLNGTVDPGNLVTSATFCYGTASDLTGCTEIAADQSPLAADPSSASVSLTLTGLTGGTTYYARVQAINSTGPDAGNIVSFTTTSAPDASTVSAIFRDKAGQAILTGSIDPGGLSTNVSFCWGTTPTLVGCTSVAADQSPLSASHETGAVSKEVTGLTQGATYYFNVTATNSAGADVGSTIEFTMPLIDAPSPTISGVSPTSGDAVGGTTLTITGTNFSTVGSGPTVSVGGVAATVTGFTASALTITTPAGDPGSVDVIVFNLDGQAVRSTDAFTYTSATTYSVTYNANGATSGSAPTDATAYDYNDPVTIESAGSLARNGYEFSGWNTSDVGVGTAYSAGATPAITADLSLYAQWTAVADVGTSASSLSFGTRAVGSGSETTRTLAVTNSGAAIVSVSSPGITITGTNVGDFSVSGGTCTDGGSITAFASCTIEVAFDPQAAGARSATLSIATSDGTQTVNLAGSGTGSGPTPTPTPTPVETEAPSASAPAPVVSVVDPPVDLVAGEGAVLVDGVLVDVSITPLTGAGGAPTWAVRGPDFSLEFQPEPTSNSDALSGPSQGLSSSPGSWLNVTGDGYQAASAVKAYLILQAPVVRSARPGQVRSPEVIYLGEVEVAADGTFDIRVTVPDSVSLGDYVLQINGLSQQSRVRSVNMALSVEAGVSTRSLTKAAFFQGRSVVLSTNGRRKLRSMVAELPKVRQDVLVEITAVSATLDDLEEDLRRAARRGRELRDYLSDRGVTGTYAVTIRTEDQLRSAERTPPLRVSSNGKPLTTVRITFDAPR
ncbi:MAG: choice-of-anchor D domain-containing protein [Candidatus Nanopelagicales bacterium]|nr:choice-of-anchor D domain-containing protein [Candidatus Nanopelagicales bacterium]